MNASSPVCLLCQSSSTEDYYLDTRQYWQCGDCDLVFVASSEHLSEAEEKSRYDFHENNPEDLGYRKFLNRLIKPLSERLSPGSSGLDFGCGPGPTVSVMLEDLGHTMACYDKYYAPDPVVLDTPYDFITSTEVLEHLRSPGEEVSKLMQMLKPGGYLGVMTKLTPSKSDFANWHYKKDPTHICFYSESTFEWVAEQWKLSIEILDTDVVILQSGN